MLAVASTGTAESTGLTGWVVGIMETLGGPGAGLIIALENIFPPLPSELILPLAGFTASRGDMGLLSAIFWTTLGSLVGALALYGVGAALGRERTRSLAARIPLVKLSDIDKTEAWFVKHGTKAVFFGRMLPLFRSFISVPAGVERMPLGTFALLTTVGSLFWNTAFVLAGYTLGQNWHVVEQYAGVFSKGILVAVLLAAGYFAFSRLRANRRDSALAEAPTEVFEPVGGAFGEAPTEVLHRVDDRTHRDGERPTERFRRPR